MKTKNSNDKVSPPVRIEIGISCYSIPIEFFTIGVSVRLSDRSLHREEQKNSSKIVPSGDWNQAGRRSVGQEISEVSLVCFMHHFTCWTLFISRINRAWQRPWRFRLATECWLSSVGRALVWWSWSLGFNPHWGQFLTNCFLLFSV